MVVTDTIMEFRHSRKALKPLRQRQTYFSFFIKLGVVNIAISIFVDGVLMTIAFKHYIIAVIYNTGCISSTVLNILYALLHLILIVC
jgi:hypothetical protein